MRSRSAITTLASALTLTIAAANPLAAQRTSAMPAGAARVVAAYDFRNSPTDLAFPRSVTVSDSAGTLLARVDVAGENRSIPMTVTVIESTLVLQGETKEGVLTLVLDRQNEGGVTKLSSGTWTLGKYQGELRAAK